MTDMTSGTTGSYVARVVTNEAVEISAAIGEEIASWRRVFAARNPDVDARQLLQNATRELWTVLQIDRTRTPNRKWSRDKRQSTPCKRWPRVPGSATTTPKQFSPSASGNNRRKRLRYTTFRPERL